MSARVRLTTGRVWYARWYADLGLSTHIRQIAHVRKCESTIL